MELSTSKELQNKYPLCFEPIKLRVQSVVYPKNKPSINDWFNKLEVNTKYKIN